MASTRTIRVQGKLYVIDGGFIVREDGGLVSQAEQAKVLAAFKRREVRRAKDALLRSMGLVKVKGALGGTYWE